MEIATLTHPTTEEATTAPSADTLPTTHDVSLPPSTIPAAPIILVPVEAINADPDQPRRRYDADKLQALAADIAHHGIELPLLVRPLTGENVAEGTYQLIAGERRFRAARMANLTHVPVLIKEGISESEAALLQIRENLLRAELSPIEEARGLRRYKAISQKTWAMIAAELGWTRQTLLCKSRLLEAPEPIQALIEEGTFPPSYYQEISSLPEAEQLRLAELTVSERLRISDLRNKKGRMKEEARTAQDGAESSSEEEREGHAVGTPPEPSLEGEQPPLQEKGNGTVTLEPTVKITGTEITSLTQRGSKMQSAEVPPSEPEPMEDSQEESAKTEGNGTVTLPVVMEKVETKELRVALDATVYDRLERHATKRGKSLVGFTRSALGKLVDLLDEGRWEEGTLREAA